jgi:hypothetical protein
MPRYYFDVRRDGATARDRDGVDLPNVAAARAAAKVMATVMVFDGMSPEEMRGFGIMVRDESGKVLFEVNAFVWTQDPPNELSRFGRRGRTKNCRVRASHSHNAV